jgi:hypothetical protein
MHATNEVVPDFKSELANGNGHGRTTGSFRKATSTRPNDNQVIDIILKMHTALFEFGRGRAEKSRDINPNQTDLVTLEEHANAMAEEAYRERYDPENNEEHKRREAEYQKVLGERPEAELTRDYFEADVLRLEEEMAQAQVNMRTPNTPSVLMISSVAGLALTIAPTLHDYVFITMTDDVLNWAISILSSTIYGIFITWGLLDTDDSSGRRTIRNWLGLVGGIAIPIGLGILRVANAVGTPEILFAVALTIIEIGIVVLLESRSKTLRVAYQEWAGQQAIINNISTRLEAARAQLERCKEKIKMMTEFIDAHIRLVEELSIRNSNIDRIRADAVKAVRDGYFEGLAINRGYLRGAGRIAL